jgi:CTP:phosphocholine cytidylyltransferase-like protein
MHNIDNAVILAAGCSSRFVPLCHDIPKGLLRVKSEILIERQIIQLQDLGINDITVITGYQAKQYEYLHKKYNIRLLFNIDFANKNNFASIYTARNVLKNTIISSSDLYFKKNIFQNCSDRSYYASIFIKEKTGQRSLTLDKNDKITGVTYGGENTWITFGGHALLLKELSEKLTNIIQPVYNNPEYANKYWVDIMDEHLDELPMHIKRINTGDIEEFNSLESLWNFDVNFISSNYSPTMRNILNHLKCDNERELSNFTPIIKNNYAVGCFFYYNNLKYKYIFNNNFIERRDNEK